MIGALLAAGAVASPVALVVATPGVDPEAHLGLVRALAAEGLQVEIVALPCSGGSQDLARAVVRAADPLDRPVVVAHGLGATLALLAGPRLDAAGFVLLGPVLAPPRTAATSALTGPVAGPLVDLGTPLPWEGKVVQELLLGAGPQAPLGCVSASLAREVGGWVREGVVPLDLGAVTRPVWIGAALLDEVAPPEILVPASRGLPRRELVRLGITRLDPRDFTHLELLTDPIPVRAAARAARALAGSR